jgi:uncharacterized protein HemX
MGAISFLAKNENNSFTPKNLPLKSQKPIEKTDTVSRAVFSENIKNNETQNKSWYIIPILCAALTIVGVAGFFQYNAEIEKVHTLAKEKIKELNKSAQELKDLLNQINQIFKKFHELSKVACTTLCERARTDGENAEAFDFLEKNKKAFTQCISVLGEKFCE